MNTPEIEPKGLTHKMLGAISFISMVLGDRYTVGGSDHVEWVTPIEVVVYFGRLDLVLIPPVDDEAEYDWAHLITSYCAMHDITFEWTDQIGEQDIPTAA